MRASCLGRTQMVWSVREEAEALQPKRRRSSRVLEPQNVLEMQTARCFNVVSASTFPGRGLNESRLELRLGRNGVLVP